MGIYIPIIVAFVGSGIWTFLTEMIKLKTEKTSAERKMLLGLGHDVLYARLTFYLEQGWIDAPAMENLRYVFDPYKMIGGNGTCEALYNEVLRLPHTPPEKKDGDK